MPTLWSRSYDWLDAVLLYKVHGQGTCSIVVVPHNLWPIIDLLKYPWTLSNPQRTWPVSPIVSYCNWICPYCPYWRKVQFLAWDGPYEFLQVWLCKLENRSWPLWWWATQCICHYPQAERPHEGRTIFYFGNRAEFVKGLKSQVGKYLLWRRCWNHNWAIEARFDRWVPNFNYTSFFS